MPRLPSPESSLQPSTLRATVNQELELLQFEDRCIAQPEIVDGQEQLLPRQQALM